MYQNLNTLEQKQQMKSSRPKRYELNGEWRNLHSQKLQKLRLPSTVRLKQVMYDGLDK
jgi:hypothetical protein